MPRTCRSLCLGLLALTLLACGDDGGTSPGTTGVIEGTVQLAGALDHGGVLVVVNETGDTATSATDGRFRLPNVMPGSVTLTASRTGFVSATSAALAVSAGQITAAGTLELVAVRGVITGTVRREGETDPSGVVVQLLGTTEEVITAADGGFTFANVPVGTQVVEAQAEGFEPARSAPLTILGDAPVDAGQLVLARSRGSLAGTATLEGESDHSGILVSLQGTPYATLTGPSGAYTFSGVPVGQYTVEATRSGFATASASDQTVTAGMTTAVPALVLSGNPGRVTGTARLEGRSDHAGILVKLDGTSLETVTDAAGQYAIDAVAQGSYTVTATYAGFDAATSGIVIVTPGATATVGDLTLEVARGALTGTAQLQGETDHGGILVEVVGQPFSAVTNADGQYYLASVPVGTYTVRATHAGFLPALAAAVTVVAHDVVDVDPLVLGASPGTLTGIALKEGATNHAGILVTVNNTPASGSTDQDGRFTITGVPSGVLSISASADEHARYDYPLAVLDAGDTLDLGTVTLSRARGLVEGVVTVEGRSQYTGVLVELLGTTYTATSGADGRWSLNVPVGTYGGVRASLPHYLPDEELTTISVNTVSPANVAPLHLTGYDNELRGEATLFGQSDHTGITVELLGVDGTETEALHQITVTTDPAGTFAFASVPLGPWRVRYTYQPGWSVLVRDQLVVPGEPIDLEPATLRRLYVLINDDTAWTNQAAVTLSLGSDDCVDLKVSQSSDLAGAAWEPCAPTRAFTLTGADGVKAVYAQFRDSLGIPGVIVSDEILLDRTAVITSVTHDAGGVPKKKNDVIHFTLNAAGEPGGTAYVDVVGFQSGILLHDDGTHGDAVAGNGVYETDYVVPAQGDVNAAVVRGRFTDSHANDAVNVNASTALTIANPPVIFNVRIVPDTTHGTAAVSWDTDEPTTGQIQWGTTALYGNTVPVPAPAAMTHTVSIGGGALVPSQEYHVRITATDAATNSAYTSDRIFYLKPSPPTMVIAMPGDGRFDVRWEAPPQDNVVGYNVYRSSVAGGPYATLNATGLYNHEALMYSDLAVVNDATYFYVITAVDEFGHESDRSEEVGGMPEANSGPTYVGGALVGNQVWTTKGSPYIISNNTLVTEDSYLAIGAGVAVQFDGYYILRVAGTAYFIGSNGDNIRVTTVNSNPTQSDWESIEILSNTSNFDENSGRYFGGNIVSNAQISNAGSGAILIRNGSLFLHKTEISENHAMKCKILNPSDCRMAGGVVVDSSYLLAVGVSIIRNRATNYYSASFSPYPGLANVMGSAGLYAYNGRIVVLNSQLSENSLGRGPDAYSLGGSGCALQLSESSGVIVDSLIESNRCASTLDWNGIVSLYHSDILVANSMLVANILNSIQGYALYVQNNSGNDVVLSNWLLEDNIVNGSYSGSLFRVVYGNMLAIGGEVYSNSVDPIRSDLSALISAHVAGHCESQFVKFHSMAIAGNYVTQLPLFREFHGEIEGLHVDASQVGLAALLPCHGYDAALTSSNLLLSSSEPLIVNSTEDTGPDVLAKGNFWGDSTSEMDTLGPNANISAIHDFYDDITLSKVLYDNWAHSAFPMARIDTPRWGKKFRQGKPVTITGHADDIEDGPITGAALSWSSSVDGLLGTGDAINTSTLSVGTHQIWLTATDSMGQEGKIYVELEIVP